MTVTGQKFPTPCCVEGTVVHKSRVDVWAEIPKIITVIMGEIERIAEKVRQPFHLIVNEFTSNHLNIYMLL